MPSSFVIIIELKQGGDSNGSLKREILPKAVRLTRKQGGYIVNRKLLSLFMAVVMTLSLSIPAFASENASRDYISIEDLNRYHNEVRTLQSQRSLLQMAQYENANTGIATASLAAANAQLEEIDAKLNTLGVRKVSLSELSFVAKSRSIEVPEADNERWELEEYTNVIYNGARYDVSVLTAQSKNTASMLYDSDAKILHAAPGVAAGTAHYLRIIATAASGTFGTVAGTIYDAISTTVSNLTSSTIIENVSATYNWQCDTLMHFVYVKRSSFTGDPSLSYVYNEVNTSAVGVTNNVRFNSTSHNDLNYNVYQQRQRNTMNTGASSLNNAIDSFLNYSQIMHSFVNYVTITGVGNKTVIKHYVCREVYPGMIY